MSLLSGPTELQGKDDPVELEWRVKTGSSELERSTGIRGSLNVSLGNRALVD